MPASTPEGTGRAREALKLMREDDTIRWTGGHGLIVALALLAGLWLATLAAYRPQAPQGTEVPPTDFSAARAMTLLQELVGDSVPHPMGSAADAKLRERIVQRLRQLGYEPELQSGILGCDKYAVCGMPTNIVARLPGAEDGAIAGDAPDAPNPGSVLLAAHYDSVPAGPGASDDGAGVAIVLEIARILALRPRARHPIILLIDEGEEVGLLGAEVFVQHHRWARSVRAAVNIDNRGTSGPSLMFETGSANAWLMRLYTQAIARPLTNSVYYSVYQRMPNDTDFTVFRAAGYQGYNFAFIGDVANYHTPQDDVRHADARSVQQEGDDALAALLVLASSAIDRPAAGESVYFDVLGRTFVRLPHSLMLPAAIATFMLLLIAAACLVRRDMVSRVELAWAPAAAVLTPLGAGAIGAALLGLLGVIAPAGVPAFAAHPWVLISTFTGLAAGTIGAVSVALRDRAGFWSLWCANALWTALLAILLAAWLPGASYLPLLPAIVGLLALVGRLGSGRDRAAVRIFATLGYLLVMFTLLWPIVVPLHAALGTAGLPVFGVLLAFGAGPLAGLLLLAGRRVRGLFAGAAATVTVVGFSLAVMMPAYTADSPERLNISYELDHDSAHGTAHARWLVLPDSGHLPPVFGQMAHFSALGDSSLSPLLNLRGQRMFAADAPILDLPPPQMTWVATTASPDQSLPQRRLRYRVRVVSRRGAPTLQVAFPLAAQIRSVSVSMAGAADVTRAADGVDRNGDLSVPMRLLPAARGWEMLTLVGVPAQGADLWFDAIDAPFDVNLLDRSDGLPAAARALLTARPPTATASQNGDVTAVIVTFHGLSERAPALPEPGARPDSQTRPAAGR